MTTGVHPSYPQAAGAVRDLVREHLKLTDEPLLLAVYYAPQRDEQDIFLFEVIDGFGADVIDDRQEIFEMTYAARSTFPLAPGQQLHLVLTSLPEFQEAVREKWPAIRELQEAIRTNHYEVAFQAPGHAHLLEMLK